jgi:hypothetical protein
MTNRSKRVTTAGGILLLWIVFTVADTDLSYNILVTGLLGLIFILLLIVTAMLLIAGLAGFRKKRAVWFAFAGIIILFLSSSMFVARSVGNATREQSKAHGDNIITAIERYRVAKGVYPDSLASLKPQFIDLLPCARIGVFVKSPFWYSAHENTFSLCFPQPAWMICMYDPRTGKWALDD